LKRIKTVENHANKVNFYVFQNLYILTLNNKFKENLNVPFFRFFGYFEA